MQPSPRYNTQLATAIQAKQTQPTSKAGRKGLKAATMAVVEEQGGGLQKEKLRVKCFRSKTRHSLDIAAVGFNSTTTATVALL